MKENTMKYEVNPSAACDLRRLTDVVPFQQILEILLRFDERTGRLNEQKGIDLHYMRRAVCAANPSELIVLLGRLEDGLYYICVRLDARGGILRTSWLHEDDIYRERQAAADDADHPVHQLLCMTDLYAHGRSISEDDFYCLESGSESRQAS